MLGGRGGEGDAAGACYMIECVCVCVCVVCDIHREEEYNLISVERQNTLQRFLLWGALGTHSCSSL